MPKRQPGEQYRLVLKVDTLHDGTLVDPMEVACAIIDIYNEWAAVNDAPLYDLADAEWED